MKKHVKKIKFMLLSMLLMMAFASPVAASEQSVPSATENPYKGYKLSPDKFYYRESTMFDGKAVIANYAGMEVYVPVPKEIDGMKVNQLSISGCDSVQELYLPDGIEIIDTLSDCKNLTTVHFPSTIDMIDAWFAGDVNIKHLYIPPAVTYISPEAFMQEKDGKSTAMTGIVIHGEKGSYAEEYAKAKNYEFVEYSFATEEPEVTVSMLDSEWSYSVQEDNTAVINGYDGMVTSTMNIPDDVDGYEVSGIGKSAFKDGLGDCRMLILPEGILSIDVEAFEGTGMEGVYFSGNMLTSIGAYAFAGCENLKSIEIPEGTEEIGYSAFADCKSLQSVTIPKSVVSIKDGAFAGCDVLTNISVEEGSYAEKYFEKLESTDIDEENVTEEPAQQEEPAAQKSHAGVLIFVLVLCALVFVAMILYRKDVLPEQVTDVIKKLSGNTEEAKRTTGSDINSSAGGEAEEKEKTVLESAASKWAEAKGRKADAEEVLGDSDAKRQAEVKQDNVSDAPAMTAEDLLAEATEEAAERYLE